jgi:hypothetical protein
MKKYAIIALLSNFIIIATHAMEPDKKSDMTISAPLLETKAPEIQKTPPPPMATIKKETKKEEVKPDKAEKTSLPLEMPKVTVTTEQKPDIKIKPAPAVCEQKSVWNRFDDLQAELIKTLPFIEEYAKKNPADQEKILTKMGELIELIGTSFGKVLGKTPEELQQIMVEAQAQESAMKAKTPTKK